MTIRTSISLKVPLFLFLGLWHSAPAMAQQPQAVNSERATAPNSFGDYTIFGLATSSYQAFFLPDEAVPVTAGRATAGINARLAVAGSITGRVTNASGAGIGNVDVGAYDLSFNRITSGLTNSEGYYSIPALSAGSYKIYFLHLGSNDYAEEWYNDKLDFNTADVVPVTAGSVTSGIDAQLSAKGEITGRVTNASGAGISGANVNAYDLYNRIFLTGGGSTDTLGDYRIPKLPPGSYKVRFWQSALNNCLGEWYNDKADFDTADVVSVTAGSVTPGIDAQLAEGGSITGKVTNVSGTGIRNVYAEVYDLAHGGRGSGATDSEGNYKVPGLITGSYKVYFSPLNAAGTYLSEWYDDKADFDTADVVSVTAGTATGGIDAKLTEAGRLGFSRASLRFGAVLGSVTTKPQSVTLIADGPSGGSLSWAATASEPWISVSPAGGTVTSVLTISVDPTGLTVGSYYGYVTVTASGAINSPQYVTIAFRVYDAGASAEPIGYFDTPAGGSTVMGSIPVSGWALDDIEVTKVEIRRDPVAGDSPGDIGADGLVYIGDSTFVEGARPDIERIYPSYPLNYRGGWGYMMLTYGLPDHGNGTFVLHAVAFDKDGHRKDLGTKTIVSDNAHNDKPFGAIDTPEQGATVSGNPYVNFGWVLTPPPAMVPIDGSTIWLWIDGVKVGNPTYNNYRVDVHDAYPEYLNADGAVGFYNIDTTAYANGMHTIAWSAKDDQTKEGGLGSRFFWVSNTPSGARALGLSAQVPSSSSGAQANTVKAAARNGGLVSGVPLGIPPSTGIGSLADLSGMASDILSPVYVRTGFRDEGSYDAIAPDVLGVRAINVEEAGRIVISLESAAGLPGLGRGRSEDLRADRISAEPLMPSRWSGYLVVGTELRPLPIGSTLDTRSGVFYWQPGPGFLGEYRLIFIDHKGGAKKYMTMSIGTKNFPQRR